MKNKIKILLVGCGSIGLRHLKNLNIFFHSNIHLAAMDISETSKKQVKEIHQDILFFDNKENAAQWKPDLVIVATPNHLHLSYSLWAFENNAHVLCEKPLADSYKNALKMVKKAKQKDKILAVGFTERYREAIQYMINEVDSGALGTIIGGRAMVGTYNTLLCAKDPLDRCSIYGNLIYDYTHELDILCKIFGNVKTLQCSATELGKKKFTAKPTATSIILNFETGALVSVHMDYIQHPQRRIMEIYGDQKSFCYNFHTDTLEIFDTDKPGCEIRTFGNVRNEQFMREYEDMFSAMANNIPPKVSGEQALESLKIAEETVKQLKKQCHHSG